jgi:hypothetical protein
MNKPVIYTLDSDFSKYNIIFNHHKLLTCNNSILYMELPVTNIEFDKSGNGCILVNYDSTISLISIGLQNCIHDGTLNIKVNEQTKFFYENKLVTNIDLSTVGECGLIVYFTENYAITKQLFIKSYKEDDDNDDLWNEPINTKVSCKLEEINTNDIISDNSKKVVVLPQPKEIYTTRAKILMDQAKEYENHASTLKKQAEIIYDSYLK